MHGRRVLLLMNNTSFHYGAAECYNVKMSFLPPYMTAQLQPRDSGKFNGCSLDHQLLTYFFPDKKLYGHLKRAIARNLFDRSWMQSHRNRPKVEYPGGCAHRYIKLEGGTRAIYSQLLEQVCYRGVGNDGRYHPTTRLKHTHRWIDCKRADQAHERFDLQRQCLRLHRFGWRLADRVWLRRDIVWEEWERQWWWQCRWGGDWAIRGFRLLSPSVIIFSLQNDSEDLTKKPESITENIW